MLLPELAQEEEEENGLNRRQLVQPPGWRAMCEWRCEAGLQWSRAGADHLPPSATEPQGPQGEELLQTRPHLELGAEWSGWRKVVAV